MKRWPGVSTTASRTALDLGVRFEFRTFSLLGASMPPLQMLAAYAGLVLIRPG